MRAKGRKQEERLQGKHDGKVGVYKEEKELKEIPCIGESYPVLQKEIKSRAGLYLTD